MDRVRTLIHMDKTRRLGYRGKHIRVALLDTGVADHPDLDGRIVTFRDFVHGRSRMYDDNGHGTHIAGIICGNGKASKGRYAGIAPEAELIVLKILDQDGGGSTETALRALKWIEEHREAYHIRLLNFSFGYLPGIHREQQRRLLTAVDALWDAGVTVVCAAGNNGPRPGTVTVPGISRNIITVGAFDDGTPGECVGNSRYDGNDESASEAGYNNDNRTARIHLNRSYSGSGPTDCCIVKPEILAPGTNIRSLDPNGGYSIKSGTSMAAPVVCGALALAFEKDPTLRPALMKLALYESVEREPAELFQNCWGRLHVDNLLAQI